MTSLSLQRPRLDSFLETDVYPGLGLQGAFPHLGSVPGNTQNVRSSCPFCSSKSKDCFSIDRVSLVFHCFRCGESGTPIHYWARTQGHSGKVRGKLFIEAVEALCHRAGIVLPQRELTPEAAAQRKFIEDRRAVLELVQDTCQKAIWSAEGSQALLYLNNERGFQYDEIRELGIGYFSSTRALRAALVSKGIDLTVAKDAGVLSRAWEGYLVFPIHECSGEIFSLAGRYAAKSLPRGKKKTRVLPGKSGKRCLLYLDRALRSGAKSITLVEGVIDAALAQVRGDNSCVGTLGCTPSHEQIESIASCKLPATICMDDDPAGQKGALTAARRLRQHGVAVRVAGPLPNKSDPDEFIRTQGLAAWLDHVKNATDGDVFLLSQIKTDVTKGAGWDENLRALFVERAKQDGLSDEACLWLIEDHVRLGSSNPADCFTQLINSALLVNCVSSISHMDRSKFEALLDQLKRGGFKSDQIRSIRAAVRDKLRKSPPQQRKRDRRQELARVDPDLNAPAPAGLLIPPRYELNRDGVYRLQEIEPGLTEKIRFCTAPLVISKRFEDISSGEEMVELAWVRDGRWKTHTCGRGVIAESRGIVSIAEFGLPITSQTSKSFVEYLADFEQLNCDILRPVRITDRQGWHNIGGQRHFVAGATVLSRRASYLGPRAPVVLRGADQGERQLVHGVRRAGTFDRWKEAIDPVAAHESAVAGLLLSLSTPLLEVLRVSNPIGSWSGRTSVGKTTALRIFASIWGDPAEESSDGLVRSWDSTRVYIERLSALFNGIPIFLDETSLIGNPGRLVSQVIYGVSGGQGRGRGSRSGLRKSMSWRTALLSTGEQALASFTASHGGTHARILEFQGSPFGTAAQATLIANLIDGISGNFGFAGPAFASYVLCHLDESGEWLRQYRSLVRDMQARAGDNVVAGRLGKLVALLQLVAQLADVDAAGVLPWSYFDMVGVFDRLWDSVVAGARTADRDAEALRQLLSWIRRNPHLLDTRTHDAAADDAPPPGWAGFWRNGGLALFPDRLERLLEELGFAPQAILTAWRDRGWLDCPSGEMRRQLRWRGQRARFYVVRKQAIDAVEPDQEQEIRDTRDETCDR